MNFREKKSTKTILSDKIADALTVRPRADIEDDQVFGTKPKTVTRADFSSSDSEEEAAISDFRKRNVNLLSDISKKYEGKAVSRKELEKNDSDKSESESSSDNENDISPANILKSEEIKSSESDSELSCTQISTDKINDSSDSESTDYSITKLQKLSSSDSSDDGSDKTDEGSDGDDDEGEEYDISQMNEPIKETFEHVKKQNVSEEAKKGACVRNQLLIWESLLEMRIHVQRCVNTANQMPLPDTCDSLKANEKYQEKCNMIKANVANVLDKLLTLQSVLLKNFPETKMLCKSKLTTEPQQEPKTESDEEIPSDTDNEEIPSDTEDEFKSKTISPQKTTNTKQTKKRKLPEYENEIQTSHKSFKSFRDTTIQKWNDKTRLATAANIKNAPTNTILQQISYILSDRNKLIRRTQLKRSDYEILGYKKNLDMGEGKDQNTELHPVIRNRKDDDEYIPEIFDDSDFYHQLLRELIECKSADISDPVQLSRQWIALQQMRSKMKRKVDTKATKGRKIKYVVHNKLVNYMAPEKCNSWNDEQTTELYSSLFGKMFENNNVGLNVNLENGFN